MKNKNRRELLKDVFPMKIKNCHSIENKITKNKEV